MSEPTLLDPLDRYQYLAFRWLLFIIFLVMAFKMLDEHIHLTRHFRQFVLWLSRMFKS